MIDILVCLNLKLKAEKMKTFIFEYDIKAVWQKPPTKKARIFAVDKNHAKEILTRNFGSYQSDIIINFDTLKETNFCLVSKLHKLDVKYY